MKNKDVVKQFSSELRRLRKEHNLTQEQISEKSGISYKNIQYLESTKKPTCPSLKTLYKLADGFGITLKELVKNIA